MLWSAPGRPWSGARWVCGHRREAGVCRGRPEVLRGGFGVLSNGAEVRKGGCPHETGSVSAWRGPSLESPQGGNKGRRGGMG